MIDIKTTATLNEGQLERIVAEVMNTWYPNFNVVSVEFHARSEEMGHQRDPYTVAVFEGCTVHLEHK